MKHRKYHTGRIGVSDHVASLNITGTVEVHKAINALYFFHLNQYDSSKAISISFNSVEMRAFAYALKQEEKYINSGYLKHSGGKSTKKSITLSSNENYHYIHAKTQNHEALISFKRFEMAAFGDEIISLVTSTNNALFETQRVYEKKKNAALKIARELEKNNEKQ